MSNDRLKALYEERANIWSQMTEVIDAATKEGRDLDSEEQQKYDKAEADLDARTKEIERIERHAKHTERMEKVETDPIVNPGDEEREDDAEKEFGAIFETYVRSGMGMLDPEQRRTLQSRFRSTNEKRAQAVGTNSAGGYLVPEGFRRQLIETMKDFGSVQNVAQVINTETGNTLPWPTNDDTGNVGALLAENTQATEQDLTFGTADLGAYKYTSKIVRVSLEFLQDVEWIEAEGFMRRKLGERVARIWNQHFTTGTGTNQPQGIVTGATTGKTAAAVADLTFDELIDLEHSVDPAYRRSPRVRWMLSDTALSIARKKKDGNNNYLWQPSVQAGVASTLMGYGYEINNDMAAPAAGVKSVLFGDFEAGYIIRLVREFALIRLDERYADFGQVGFIGFARADGTVQDASAYKALAQAAA